MYVVHTGFSALSSTLAWVATWRLQGASFGAPNPTTFQCTLEGLLNNPIIGVDSSSSCTEPRSSAHLLWLSCWMFTSSKVAFSSAYALPWRQAEPHLNEHDQEKEGRKENESERYW